MIQLHRKFKKVAASHRKCEQKCKAMVKGLKHLPNMMRPRLQTPIQMRGRTQMQPLVKTPMQAQKSNTHAIMSANSNAVKRQASRNIYCMQCMRLQEYLYALPKHSEPLQCKTMKPRWCKTMIPRWCKTMNHGGAKP